MEHFDLKAWRFKTEPLTQSEMVIGAEQRVAEAGQWSPLVTVTESDAGWILQYECGMPSSLGFTGIIRGKVRAQSESSKRASG